MKHLYFFYFLLIFLLGSGAYSITWVLYKKNRVKLLRDYLLFYSSWTVMVVFNTFTVYIQTNLSDPDPVLIIFANVLRAIGVYLLILAIPAFMHYLCSVPGTFAKNLIFFLLALLLFTGYNIFQYAVTDNSIKELGPLIEGTIFSATIVYTIITGFFCCRRLQDGIIRLVIKKYAWLLMVFLPGLLCDLYFGTIVPIRFFPVFYAVLSIVFVRFFISTYWNYSLLNSDASSAPHDSLPSLIFEQYNITEREREIITSVLQGLSNPQIAEKHFISLSTVKTHLRNIFSKTGVKSRYELIIQIKDRSHLIS